MSISAEFEQHPLEAGPIVYFRQTGNWFRQGPRSDHAGGRKSDVAQRLHNTRATTPIRCRLCLTKLKELIQEMPVSAPCSGMNAPYRPVAAPEFKTQVA